MTMLPLMLSTRYNQKHFVESTAGDDFFLPLTTTRAHTQRAAKSAATDRQESSYKSEQRREQELWASTSSSHNVLGKSFSVLEKPVSGMYRYGPAHHENAEAERLLRKQLWLLAEQRSRTLLDIEVDKARFIELQKQKVKRMPRLLVGIDLDRYHVNATSAATTASRMKKQRTVQILLKIEICEARLVEHVKEHSKRRLMSDQAAEFPIDPESESTEGAMPPAEMNEDETVNVLAYRDFVKLRKNGLITEIRSSFYDDFSVDGAFREELFYCAKLLEHLCLPICQKRCPVMMALLRTHRRLSEFLQAPTPELKVRHKKLTDYALAASKAAVMRDHRLTDLTQSLSTARMGDDPDRARKDKVIAVIRKLEKIRSMPNFTSYLSRDKPTDY